MITLPEWYEIEEQWPVLAALALIEILLSVDNVLAVSELASHLPSRTRFFALKLAALGTYVARIVGLLVIAPLISMFVWLRILGALYLIYVMSSHFIGKRDKSVGHSTEEWSMARTVGSIFLMDLVLSIDNIVASVSMSRMLWVVCSSVLFGIVFIRILGPLTVKVIKKFPVLSDSVYVLIGWIGVLLLAENTFDTLKVHHLTELQKFLVLLEIILFTLIYDAVPALQRIVDPILRTLFMPVLKLVNAPLAILFWPIRKLHALALGHD